MKRRIGLIWVLLTILVGCDVIRDSSAVVTLTPRPTLTPLPTAIPPNATGTGVTFYTAWQNSDYVGMYSLLSTQTKALIEQEIFIDRYETVMDTARVLAVNAQPMSSFQEGNSAELNLRVTWETAVVGTIVRDHVLNMAYENEKWVVLWDESLIMPDLAGGNELKLNIQVPSRANLYDRGEDVLAYQGSGVVVGVIPGKLEDEAGFLNAISQILQLPTDEIRGIYADVPPEWYVPLGVVSAETIQDNFYALEPYFDKGLENKEGRGRLYTTSGVAPHLIGYMNPIPADEAADFWALGYRASESVGVAGLERAAERYLAGERGGQLLLVNRSGESLDIIQETEARPGRAVHTTFDSAFQLAVQGVLSDAIRTHPEGHSGAIVVLDVNTGAVRAMASYPAYDASVFSQIRLDTTNEIGRLLNDSTRPLLNRATQGAYPPGSTFKIATMSAGIESTHYLPETSYYCSGTWLGLGEANIKYDWLLEGHGPVNIVQGLARSCNTYSYEIGYVLDQDDPYLLPNMARAYGLGAATDIQLPEVSGIIPDPTWKMERFGDGWSPGDSVNMAIGQGFVEATPLQIANMTAAVANGGTLYRPNLIERVEGDTSAPEQVTQPIVLREVGLSDSNITAIQQALNDVTSGAWGTAVDKMAGLEISTAGKTGTAQVFGEGVEPHSWFTGYAPAQNPEIAITVIIENAGEGSAVAAPVFRRIIETYYEQEITPFPWQQ